VAEKQFELLYGVHPILELLQAKRRKIVRIYTTKPEPKAWSLIAKILPKQIPIQYVQRSVLDKLAGTTDHQSILAYATPFIKRKKFFDPQKSPFLILLDGVQDPRNLGAIIRSAYCVGVDGILLSGRNSAPLNPTALKASAGLAEHLDIYESSTAHAALLELQKNKYHIYLATLDGDDATQVAFTKPACLVIGNEAVGISKSLLSFGQQVRLPQRREDISYNASVAAGILLFLMAHQSC
jgi:23S rRNA (guanosine2251-2'-O)-methyltransferase